MKQAIQKLLGERYYLPHENKWNHMADRVSVIYPPIKESIRRKEFIPSSPTLMNANTRGLRKGTLSSCFIMGIEDSIAEIFDALKEAALVTKASGGVGYVFSRLRSTGEIIKSLGRPSSGPIPFMHIFDSMLDGIQQGGVRRGAGMAQFDVTHPQILDVIKEKHDKKVLQRLNISIRLTDAFYKQLKEAPNSTFEVYDKQGTATYLSDSKGKTLTITDVWNEIIEYAWLNGDPGIFNSDIATRQCTVVSIGAYVASNPCAEFVGIPDSSCNLGSINFAMMLKKDVITGNWIIDFEKLDRTVRIATRFLNAIIDVNDFPLEKIKDMAVKIRPIGLGIMGFAHMLYLLQIPYNSPEALLLGEQLMHRITTISMEESINMAIEVKHPYPVFVYEEYMKANERFFTPKDWWTQEEHNRMADIACYLNVFGIMNSCQTSIAPTGTISFVAGTVLDLESGTSGGIEPVYGLVSSRKIEKLGGEYETVYMIDPVFENYLWYETNFDSIEIPIILEKVSKNKGSCQGIDEIPLEWQKIFVTAQDLTPNEHLEMLGVIARNTSLSVSKTINLPNSATRKQISDVYLRAHELGIIGVTVYRDRCRDQILTAGKETVPEEVKLTRPPSLDADFHSTTIHGQKFAIVVGLYNGQPYEVFALKMTIKHKDRKGKLVKVSKTRYDFIADTLTIENINVTQPEEKAITLMASMSLRHGVPIISVIKTITKASDNVTDFASAIVRVLKKYIKEEYQTCPECGEKLIFIDGCTSCPNCGFSKCS